MRTITLASFVAATFVTLSLLLAASNAQTAQDTLPPAISQVTAFDCSTVSEIPQVECQALVALYNSTNGPGWTNRSGWLATTTPCSWYGVTCQTGHVTAIRLSQNALSGSIPPDLASLAALRFLEMDGNQLTGSIPPELGGLGQLQSFYLSDNQLTGSIPPQLGSLALVQSFGLDGNQLTGAIPAELAGLSNAMTLYLQDNQLTGSIPPQLGSLAQLEIMYLSNNHLTGTIPSQLGNLVHLQGLFLAINGLTGRVPPELGNLASLRSLALDNTQLSGSLPQNLTSLSLTLFRFDATALCEPGDAAFQAWLASIAILYRTGVICGLEPTPTATPTATTTPTRTATATATSTRVATTTAVAFDCSLVSDIPQVECEALYALYVGTDGPNWTNRTNWLVTTTACSWYGVTCQAGRVFRIGLQSNGLAGPIPPQVGNLTGLQVLYLYENQLRGSIPAELGNLTGLLWLSLRGNQLSGSIPPELSKLTSLQILRLYSNRLTGGIPSQLGNLTHLDELLVHDNPLSGELPRSLMNLHPTWFHFRDTSLCEPGDATFQAWLTSIPNVQRSGAICRARTIWLPVIVAP